MRTEKVYDYVIERPVPNMMSRIKSSLSWGSVAGIIGLFYTILEAIVLCLTEILLPESEIDICRSFESKIYNKNPTSFGNHVFVVDATEE